MKTRKFILGLALLCSCAFCADAEWGARPCTKLVEGLNQAGNPCITAVGKGEGKGYGGITLKTTLDMTGATAQDALRIRLFQNLGGIVVMLKGPKSEIHRTTRTPIDGKELVLDFDRSKWKTGKGDPNSFDVYNEVLFYYANFKQPWQRMSITSLNITKGGTSLFSYESNNPAPVLAHKVTNFGHGGWNSEEMLTYQVPKALRLKPTLAIIMIGTNDMLNGKKLRTYEQVEANLRKAVTTFQEKETKVIIVTSPPCIEEVVLKRHGKTEYTEAPSMKLTKLAAIQKKVALELNCPVVDYQEIVAKHAPLDGKDSLIRNPINRALQDGVHPTAEGYRILANAIAETIRNNQLPTSCVVCLGDSITFGAGMVGAGTATGVTYPAVLSQILNK